jgi:ABC-type antimicrobial peptide transport system permease subunit
MYIQSVIIAGFSYGIGLIIYFISLPAQETFGLTIELNFIFYLLIFLLVFILITLSYIPTIKKISTVSPVDKRLWR